MTRTGKNAGLAKTIREELNHRLEQGGNGGEWLKWLNSLPEVQAQALSEVDRRAIVDTVDKPRHSHGFTARWSRNRKGPNHNTSWKTIGHKGTQRTQGKTGISNHEMLEINEKDGQFWPRRGAEGANKTFRTDAASSGYFLTDPGLEAKRDTQRDGAATGSPEGRACPTEFENSSDPVYPA